MAYTLLVLMLLLASFARADGHMGVKVAAVDYARLRVTLYLPTHFATLETEVMGEPEIRLKLGEFYGAEIVSGEINTIKPSEVLVTVPDEKKVKLRIRRITFSD